VPEGDWGTRVAAAFDEELRAAGGLVLGQSTFNTADRDYGASIMQVLRTDNSRARHQRIQATIGQKLEFEPRRRADIQFIFAPCNLPTPARLLRPQLRFHLAGDIPTYTLGDAYEPHPTANEEIDGVMFPDMPWMVVTPASRPRCVPPQCRRSAIRPRAAEGCSPLDTTRCASRARCNEARRSAPTA
jgi:outer membrane PBP1 activator LpoA protein